MHLSFPLLLVQNFLFSGESIYVKNGNSPAGQGEVTCAPLSNQELYSSVKVSIGDPAQTFDLVADTGSDTCIVRDCSCAQCPAEWGSCFNGRELSKSFKLPTSEAPWLQMWMPFKNNVQRESRSNREWCVNVQAYSYILYWLYIYIYTYISFIHASYA